MHFRSNGVSAINAQCNISPVSYSPTSKRASVGLVEELDAMVHGVAYKYCPIVRTTLSLRAEDRRVSRVSAVPSSHIHAPNYPVVYLPREGLSVAASDGLIVRLSTTARVAKSRIFSFGLVASADILLTG
jgi:hypothetical protein